MQEAQEERDKKKNKELSRLLATVVTGQDRKGDRKGVWKGAKVDKDQCAYCKEQGHWVRDYNLEAKITNLPPDSGGLGRSGQEPP